MRVHNGGQGALRGFRVHPEFGWCHRALQILGYKVAPQRPLQWYKQRDLLRIGEEEMLSRTWVHVPKRGLRPK
jgi:hypothetical protein